MTTYTAEEKFKNLFILIDRDNYEVTKEKLLLVKGLAESGPEGLAKLLLLLITNTSSDEEHVNFIDEYIYKILLGCNNQEILNALKDNFKDAIVSKKSELGVDYQPLEILLMKKQFQEADQLTQCLLCKLSQKINSHSRSWLYFTDIASLPTTDLRTIDQLWTIYSEGLFGISIQRTIWLSNNSDWEKFLEKIGWTHSKANKRYPLEFEWSLKAPRGHLPLFNQLRGVQVLEALFIHSAWENKYIG